MEEIQLFKLVEKKLDNKLKFNYNNTNNTNNCLEFSCGDEDIPHHKKAFSLSKFKKLSKNNITTSN